MFGTRMRRGLAGAAALVLALLMLSSGPGFAEAPDPLADKHRLKRLSNGPLRYFTFPETASPAPDVSVTDAEGKPRTLKEWRGKSVLINFWAPWCASCREELPALQNLKRVLAKQDFEVLLFNVDTDPAKAAALLDELRVDKLVSLQDGSKQAFKAMTGLGVPTSVLVDCHGRELGRIKGNTRWDSDQGVVLVRAMMRAAGCYDDERDKL